MEKNEQKANHQSLWRKWKQDGDISAYEILLENFLPLVNYVANRLTIGLTAGIDEDDLISYGRLGLLDALNKFDFERGLQFETYAMWRIRGAIIDGLRENDWIPRSAREKAKRIEQAYAVLEQKNLRSVSDREVCEYLNITEKEFAQIISDTSFASLLSLDQPIDMDEYRTERKEVLVDDKLKTPEEHIEDSGLKEILMQAIERLPEKERMVISLFYYEELTLTEIAGILGLSPSRISQLHSKAIYRLRGSLARLKKQIF